MKQIIVQANASAALGMFGIAFFWYASGYYFVAWTAWVNLLSLAAVFSLVSIIGTWAERH